MPTPNQEISETAASRVETRIRMDIAAGRLKQGERLKMASLAQKYGSSSLPIREALRTLTGEGLIQIHPHKGAVVRSVDRKFVVNHYETQEVLEALLVSKCAALATQASYGELSRLADEYEASAASGDIAGMIAANRNLHHAIHRLADNREASSMTARGIELISGLRMEYGYGAGRTDTNIRQHRALVEAIGARDFELAKAISISHTRSSLKDLLSQMEARGNGAVAALPGTAIRAKP